MKVSYIIDNKYIVYLNNNYYSFSKDTIEKCISKILLFLSKKYNLDIHSTFNIKCYIGKYNTILEIEKEYDPFSIYTKKTDLNIKFINTLILYKLKDYFIYPIKYKYNNSYYIDEVNDIKLLEHIDSMIYGSIANNIVNNN